MKGAPSRSPLALPPSGDALAGTDERTAFGDLWSATALLLSIGCVAGILLGGRGVALPLLVAAPIAVVALTAALVWRRERRAWLPLLALVALLLGLQRYADTRPPVGPGTLPGSIGRLVTLHGIVGAEPEVLDRGENVRVTAATLALATSAPPRPVSGTVLVHLGAATALSYGDDVVLTGLLAAPPDLPGAAMGSYRAYLAAQGIATVIDYPRLQVVGSGDGSPLQALALALRGLLEKGINQSLPAPLSTLLLGILLGVRTRALGVLTAPFITVGMIHVVAISGLKISIVVGTASRLASRLLGPRRALWPSLAVLVLYVLVTGATPAGLRAGVMWTLALVAVRVGRRSDGLTSLALAAAFLGLLTPRILWDLGFQLSLAGTAAVVLLVPGVERALGRLRVPPLLREGLAVTLAAQAGTLPLIASGFNQTSFVAPLANALLLPLLEPIMALGLPTAALGSVVPVLGRLLGEFVSPFLALMIAVVRLLSTLPLASAPAGTWPVAVVLGYYGCLGVVARRLAAPRPPAAGKPTPASPSRRTFLAPLWMMSLSRRWEALGAFRRPLLGLSAAVFLFGATALAQAPRGTETVTILPLGRGMGVLATTPGGASVLLDGGDASSALDAALGSRMPFWQSSLDAVVLSDVDRGHVAGLRNLLDRDSVTRAFDPGAVYPAADYARWRAALRGVGAAEAKLRAGMHVSLDRGAMLDVILPAALDSSTAHTPCVVRLTLGHLSVLVVNRGALDTDPTLWTVPRGTPPLRRTTVLMFGVGDGSTAAASLVALIRPRIVVLPSPQDARDDAVSDAAVRRVGRTVGALVWQSADAALSVSPDGAGGIETRQATP